MPQHQQFIPGKRSNTSRIIHYIAQQNAMNPNRSPLTCTCIPDKYDKNTIGSDNPSIRVSNNMRLAQILNSYSGGTAQFGNFYLGEPLNINYLGRTEGQSGGGGRPPRNQFN